MKILIIPSNVDYKTATGKLIEDITTICEIKNIKVIKYNNNLHKILILIVLGIKGIFKNLEIISLYPVFYLPTMNFFIKFIHILILIPLINKITIIIHDLPLLHNKYINNRKIGSLDKIYEGYIFKISKKIFCFNKAMKRYILNYNIKAKIYEYKLLPQFIDNLTIFNIDFKNRIDRFIYIGNINKNYGCYKLITILSQRHKIIVYGNGREDFTHFENIIINSPLSLNKLINNIVYYKFGIIDYSDNLKPYLKYGTGSKFSTYIIAELPLLVNENLKYPAELVKKYKIGICYKDYKDLIKQLSYLTETEYNHYIKNIIRIKQIIGDPVKYSNIYFKEL